MSLISCCASASSPEGGISLTLDTAQPGYTVVRHEGVPVLLVGPELPTSLAGKTLDISPSYEGTQIIVS